MHKHKDRIFIKQWLALKPYEKPTPTDSYYLNLCNEVKKAIASTGQSAILNSFSDVPPISMLSCFLTSYFEDMISGTNIWNTFIKTHSELYHKQLPFYDLSEYYEEEINIQDISFLIWYFFNTFQREKFISPFNHFIIEIAEKAMDVFDSAWEFAPENEHLKTFYTLDKNETDFYRARHLIDTILFNTYLFYFDTKLDLHDSEYEIIEENREDANLLSFLNENRDFTLHRAHTRLLALKGKEWASKILGEDHPLHHSFLNISQKILGYFLYKGQDENDIFIEHIASGKKFMLTKKSFDHSDKLKEIDTILFLGIVRWQDEWWFSGGFFQTEFDADLVLDEKNSVEKRKAVDFLDHEINDTAEVLEKQYTAFKDFTNGTQIVFLESNKVDVFIKSYIEYFNDSLKLTKKQRNEAKQRAREVGFFGDKDKARDFTELSDSALIFFNPKSGVEIAFEVNSAFPSPGNPFFDKNKSDEHIMRLLVAEELSTELAMFCIDNFKSELPFFNKTEGNKYIEDIDFLIRFWKKNNYFSKPSISFTG